MSVQYRALWSDESPADPPRHIEAVRRLFSSWATEDPLAEPLPDGTTTFDGPNRDRTISVRALGRDHGGAVYGMEGITQDSVSEPDGKATTWTTVTRAVTDGSSVQMWVETRVESDDLSLRVKVGRPRLVDDLLTIPGKPHLGGSPLFIDVLPVEADQMSVLVDTLRSPARTLPVIVCSEPAAGHDGMWRLRAERIARRAGGIASVITVDFAAATAMRETLGQLAIWGGGVRVYTPAPLNDPSDGWRHRYVLGHLMTSREDAMIDRIVYSVAQMSTRRRTHPLFADFTSTAPPVPGKPKEVDQDGYLSEEQAEARRLEHELERELAQEEHDALHRELNQAWGHLDRLKRTLEDQKLSSVFWATQHDAGNDIPDEVQDTDDAILTAQTYLADWLVVHPDAPRELDGINTAPQSVAWGNTTWRGFRALAAYAEARSSGFQGGFFEWCRSGPPLGWPATSKKLSMSESETVQNSSKLSAARRLPVSSDVDPSGRTTMWSHLKISEGGGDLAPRVYFHDDTHGATKKVHIGFVGPHYLMPNTKS
ncbi:hypothetical protein [Nocardioides pinisoli]|uniref:Rhodanese domain-containing protein n=1 Tax=Nocardioides pinisoli TaxID=2950279 RepID=A0ABT1KRF4_9ACTN|nr:hypothetical protein [Nocardioides pinisoli]MCP3420319.1 hypothetical protein [Nocardioides pinisoli]